MKIHHIRLIIGAFFLFAAIGEKSWPLGIFATILLYQGFTKKSCGPAGCSIEETKLKRTEAIDHE